MQKNALNALIQAACLMNEEQFKVFYDDCLPLSVKSDILEARNKCMEEDKEISKKYEVELSVYIPYQSLKYVVERAKTVKAEEVKTFITEFEVIVSKLEHIALKHKYSQLLKKIKEGYEKLDK